MNLATWTTDLRSQAIFARATALKATCDTTTSLLRACSSIQHGWPETFPRFLGRQAGLHGLMKRAVRASGAIMAWDGDSPHAVDVTKSETSAQHSDDQTWLPASRRGKM